jgi:transposase-like protein
MEGMAEWQNRRVYPVLFVDAVNVKIRNGWPTLPRYSGS